MEDLAVNRPRETIELGFTHELLNDYARCIPHLTTGDPKDQQFWRRTACRSLFGFLEAFMAVVRQHFIPDMLRERGAELRKTPEFRDYFVPMFGATEAVEFYLDGSGLGQPRDRKLSFLPSLKAVVRMAVFLSKVPKNEVDKKLSGHGWQNVVNANKVRDRITHPHQHEDVYLSDQEIKAVYDVYDWFKDVLRAIDFGDLPSRYMDEGQAPSEALVEP